MKTLRNSELSCLLFLFILVPMLLATSGCSTNFTYYTDGPLTQYLTKPIPKLNKPIARSLSVETGSIISGFQSFTGLMHSF